jgi:hypothetical protein
LKLIQARMQPGAWEYDGYLRRETDLAGLLKSDGERMRALGVEPRSVGVKLRELLTAAGSSDFARPRRVGDYQVEIHRKRGMITCPWAPGEMEVCQAGHGSFATANRFSIKHKPSRRSLTGFELTVHMIEGHGFFGGPGTRFRIEPEDTVALLGDLLFE